MRYTLIALMVFGSRLPGATIHGASFDFVDDRFELAGVVAASASSIGTKPPDAQLMSYDGRIGNVEVLIGEGRVEGLSFVRNKDFLEVSSQRFANGDQSVDGLVFREKGQHEQRRWTIVLIIGPIVADNAEITEGLYVEVAGRQATDVKAALTRIANGLWFFRACKNGMFTPTRLSEGLPPDALPLVWDKITEAEKGAEPVATANPDSAG